MLGDNPHHLSGGMLWSVTIGLGVVLDGSLIGADEMPGRLDLIVGGGVLDELPRIRAASGIPMLAIKRPSARPPTAACTPAHGGYRFVAFFPLSFAMKLPMDPTQKSANTNPRSYHAPLLCTS